MKVITSRDNAIYKSAQKLLRKKFRDQTGQYLLEGTKPLKDALATGIMIEKIFVCDGSGIDFTGFPEERIIGLSRELFAGLSDTRASQGVIAVASRPAMDLPRFLEETAGAPVIVLDRLQDPGNAGTIIRTAEAAGFAGVVCIRGTADLFAPKTVRAAAGSLFRMKVVEGIETGAAIRALKSGRRLIVSTLQDAADCFTADPAGPVALVIGNEGSGVSQAFTAAADLRVRIPMAGEIESLNAAVAAGILMYCMRPGQGGSAPDRRE